MAMCVMAVVGVAPCQCFSPGANQITSPGRISSTGPPHRRARPQPEVTIRVWPSGCVCHAVRAPGSKVTLAPCTSAGSGAWNSGSIRTVPVNHSDGPFAEGCDPALLISIDALPLLLNRLATVDDYRASDHEASRIRTQPENGVGSLFGPPHSSDWLLRDYLCPIRENLICRTKVQYGLVPFLHAMGGRTFRYSAEQIYVTSDKARVKSSATTEIMVSQ